MRQRGHAMTCLTPAFNGPKRHLTTLTRETGMRSVVVGGGVAGLAAAVQLAADGATVLLIESRDTLGGRVRLRDSGSWLLDPGLHLLRRKGPLNQLLRKLRAPRVLGTKWAYGGMLEIGGDGNLAMTALTTMSLDSEVIDKPGQLVIPRGGWSSLVGRLVVAANQLDVMFEVGKSVESLSLGTDGRIRSANIAGNDVECDAIILAVPPVESARLLETAGLDASSLRQCTEHRVAALDVALEGKPMRPYSGLFEPESGILALDVTADDRIPEGAEASECTILHAVCLKGDGDAALESIKELLDSRCSGWRSMAAARRSTTSIMLHPCSRDERVDGTMFIENSIGMAGCHVESEYHLSDAAVDTARVAAKALKPHR